MANPVSVDEQTGWIGIHRYFIRTVEQFDALLQSLVSADLQVTAQISPKALEDELGQFRLWAGTNGAHRAGRASLDHKLRMASQIHEKITRDLKGLIDAIIQARDFVNGSEIAFPRPVSPGSASTSSTSSFSDDDTLPQTTPLQYAFQEIQQRIRNLMRVSIALRQPASRDLSAKYDESIRQRFELWDLKYVEDKLAAMNGRKVITNPNSEHVRYHHELGNMISSFCSTILIRRLATANTQRRQMLNYLKAHRARISSNIESHFSGPPQNNPGPSSPKFGTASTVRNDDRKTVSSSARETTNSTIIDQTAFRDIYADVLVDDKMSDGGDTETSFAISERTTDNGSGTPRRRLQFPPPPPPDKGVELWMKPFACPLCWYIINPKSTREWNRHIIRDLKPYSCTFDECPLGLRLFDTRHEWFGHEQEYHRREWCCETCLTNYRKPEEFEHHLKYAHPGQYSDSMIKTALGMYGRPILSDQFCNICGAICSSSHLPRHLGRHMEELALFVVHNWWETGEEDEESDTDDLDDDLSTLSFHSSPDHPGRSESVASFSTDHQGSKSNSSASPEPSPLLSPDLGPTREGYVDWKLQEVLSLKRVRRITHSKIHDIPTNNDSPYAPSDPPSPLMMYIPSSSALLARIPPSGQEPLDSHELL